MRNIPKRLLFAACLVFMLCPLNVEADDDPTNYSVLPDRRKDQFQTSFGYAVFPYPYSLPGIGSGVGLVGGAMNIADTYTDAYGIIFGGDVRGASVGVADMHIVPRHLILDVGYGTVTEATEVEFLNLP